MFFPQIMRKMGERDPEGGGSDGRYGGWNRTQTASRTMFPDRFFDVGIAEEHAVTFAAGLAAAGLKPVVAVYSSFLTAGL